MKLPKRLLPILLLALLAAPALAMPYFRGAATHTDADTGPGKPPSLEDPWNVSFELETIQVEGLRHARKELLLAEARLEEGGIYGEEELGRAIDRIRRLPFVREATFGLKKGSRRGLYALEITVEETRRFFFGVNLLRSELENGDVDFDLDRDLQDDSEPGVLAGVRFFAGRYSTVFLAADHERVIAGYARNRLGHRPASLRLAYEQSTSTLVDDRTFGASIDPGLGTWSLDDSRALTAAVDVPLSGADSWGLEIEARASDSGFRSGGHENSFFFLYDDFTDHRLTASWLRDTTDDAIFAERGARQVLTLTHRRLDADLRLYFRTNAAAFQSQSLRAGFLRSRWWTLGNRHTFWGSVDVAAATTQVDGLPVQSVDVVSPVERLDVSYESAELAAAAGYRFRIFRGRRDTPDGLARGAFREVYWETTFKASRDEAFGDDIVSGALIQIEATSGVVWRTSWGVFRIGFRFVDSELEP